MIISGSGDSRASFQHMLGPKGLTEDADTAFVPYDQRLRYGHKSRKGPISIIGLPGERNKSKKQLPGLERLPLLSIGFYIECRPKSCGLLFISHLRGLPYPHTYVPK